MAYRLLKDHGVTPTREQRGPDGRYVSSLRGSRIFHCWSVRSRLWHIPVLMP